jgi:hypothetical protein
VRDGTRTGVSERLPSAHPVVTSALGTDRRAVFVVEGVEQGVQSRVVFHLRWWKEDFMNMFNRNFARLLMRGIFSRLFRGALGMRESAVSDSGRRQWFFFWGRWYREWEEKEPWSVEFELCSLHVTSSNSPNLCDDVLYYMNYII